MDVPPPNIRIDRPDTQTDEEAVTTPNFVFLFGARMVALCRAGVNGLPRARECLKSALSTANFGGNPLEN
jgi:hypothetical protein